MTSRILPASLAATILASCENPADKTTDAVVRDAVEPAAAAPAGVKYLLADSSTLGFVGSKVTGSHEGGFKAVSGFFLVTGDEVTGGEILIDMASTWSDDDKLTEHLKSDHFFDVAKHPESTFIVTGVEKTGDEAYTVSGNLTLRGVTRNISFPASAARGDDGLRVTAEFDIKRRDFGIVYDGKADDLIRDEVVIRFDLDAKPSATEA